MKKNKRVAFVTVSYKGHASVLLPQWQTDPDSHLFLLCFQNDPKFEEGRERVTIITLLSDRVSENAKEFNDIRSVRLERVLRCFLHNFNPTLVVYDFFCLEAREAARHLGVPAICSIPAMLKPNETTTCSDGVLPKEHFYWLWKHRYQVSILPVAFLGPRVAHIQRPSKFFDDCICVCLGTVVPRYPGCQEKLRGFLDDLFAYATKYQKEVRHIHLLNLDVTQQQHVPSNVHLHGYLDFIEFIQVHAPGTLIFHGGGNVYTEAVELGVPKMLVIPFFGDQFEVGRVVGNVYSGNLEHDLSTLEPTIQTPEYVHDVPFADSFIDYFRPGDLVFGHRRNRDELQRKFPSIDFHLNHYAPFETFASPGSLPVIADVYNDSFDASQSMMMGFEDFFVRLNQVRATRVVRADLPHEHALVHYCIDILRLAVNEWDSKIHFVIGPHEPGIATTIELDFIREHWDQFKDHVIFYTADDGRRCTAPFFMQHQKQHLPPFIMEGFREKSATSMQHKTLQRNLPILDRFAERYRYTPPHRLFMVHEKEPFDVHVQTCDLRVHYYYDLEQSFELQYWPSSYLINFARDVLTGAQTDRAKQRQTQDVIEEMG